MSGDLHQTASVLVPRDAHQGLEHRQEVLSWSPSPGFLSLKGNPVKKHASWHKSKQASGETKTGTWKDLSRDQGQETEPRDTALP